MSNKYENRDRAYEAWADARFPNQGASGAGVFDHPDADRVVREAFDAGWSARKSADYEAAYFVPGLTPLDLVDTDYFDGMIQRTKEKLAYFEAQKEARDKKKC